MGRAGTALLGSAFGVVADRLVGEPPLDPHPVARFGTLMTRVEERLWADSRSRGVLHAATGVAVGAAVGLPGGRSLAGTASATALAVAGRGLAEAATTVGDALERGDLDAARTALPALVGRDPSRLNEAELARAVVESVAENTVDAVVAPALWGAVAGAPGALGYRAVNTLDAMVGHHSPRYERFGWASARLDDAANYVPARVTALLVMGCRPARAAEVARTVRRDAAAHPSPNAGVAEAAFAAALGVRLGGVNRYGERVEERAALGDGRPPVGADIAAACRLSRDVSLALAAVLAAASVAPWRRRR